MAWNWQNSSSYFITLGLCTYQLINFYRISQISTRSWHFVVEQKSSDYSKLDLMVFLGVVKTFLDLQIKICGFEKILQLSRF